MCVFHLPICFDLHHCYFFPSCLARLSYFADSLAVAQLLLSSSLTLTSELDQNSGGGDSRLNLLSQSALALHCCSEANSKTKIANILTRQLKYGRLSPETLLGELQE